MEKKIVMVLMMMRIKPEFHRVFINNIEKLLVYMNEGKKILRQFQPMTSASEYSSLSLNQNNNKFFVQAGIEYQIFYSTIRNITS